MRHRRYRNFAAPARSWWRWVLDIAAVVALAALILYGVNRIEPFGWVAGVSAIDGDSLRRGDEDIRLHGIDAPEIGQQCRDGRGRTYDCGREARTALKRMIGRAEVECRISDQDRYGRAIATCFANGLELNREMVRQGWAVAYVRHTQRYLATAREAQAARRGMWQGEFEFPEDFRISREAGGRQTGAVGED